MNDLAVAPEIVAANAPEFYDIAPGETAMTHRTARIDGTLFDIFDTQLGFDHFKKRSEGGDISIALRNKAVFLRRRNVELTVRPEAGTSDDPRQKSAQAILDEVEAMIKLEMA